MISKMINSVLQTSKSDNVYCIPHNLSSYFKYIKLINFNNAPVEFRELLGYLQFFCKVKLKTAAQIPTG